jgi:sugar phosphate isomerase/epimerase
MPTRRDFLQQAGLGSAAVFLGTPGHFASTTRIGLQLYTLRRELGKDPEGTIARVAKTGYNSVEVFDYANGAFFKMTPLQFSALLRKYKLKSPSGHYMMLEFLTKGDMGVLKDNIAAAATMGHKFIVIPFLLDTMRTSLDDYKKLAEKFNIAATEAKKSGLRLAYHNHNFEFKDWGGGKTGFDIFLKETDPALVFFELDMYWVSRAGRSPIQLINENPGRFKMWHIKDMSQKLAPTYDVVGDQYFAEVGSGVIDYKEIFKYKKKSGMEYFFVEQDETSRPVFDAIANSYQYVKANLAK